MQLVARGTFVHTVLVVPLGATGWRNPCGMSRGTQAIAWRCCHPERSPKGAVEGSPMLIQEDAARAAWGTISEMELKPHRSLVDSMSVNAMSSVRSVATPPPRRF